MRTCRAAFVAAVAVLAVCQPARADDPSVLSLEEAFQRVVDAHPELAIYRHRASVLAAQVDHAALRPEVVAGVELENVLGTGAASGIRSAELTVSLGSVLERGGKQSARRELAEQRVGGLTTDRDATYLDLMAETARRYLDAAAASAHARLWALDAEQRKRTLDAAARRVSAGGAPQSSRLAAEAAALEAEGRQHRSLRSAELERLRLALLWGDRAGDFQVSDRLDHLPDVEPLPDVLARLSSTPELRAFATEERIREAKLQLARTERIADIAWEVGVRRIEADRDWALLGSVSIPLGASDRAAPGIREAEAELAALTVERDSAQRALEATLSEAYAQLDAAVAEARQIDDALLPLLTKAEQAAQRAYQAGAIGYLEWAAVQDDITDARARRLQAAVNAHRALIELQRLTGSALQPTPNTSEFDR